MKTLILGGARSGKSSYAQMLAEESNKSVTYIATATAEDAEMQKRIETHQSARPKEWVTVEEPIYLANAIKNNVSDNYLIVDCLSLWTTNLLMKSDDVFKREKENFLEIVTVLDIPINIVSNEVGMGIVPTTFIARQFRDEIGFLHQALGKICDRVILMTAGFPIRLK